MNNKLIFIKNSFPLLRVILPKQALSFLLLFSLAEASEEILTLIPPSVEVSSLVEEPEVNTPTSLTSQIQKLQKLLEKYEKQVDVVWPQWTCTNYAFREGDRDPVLLAVKKQLKAANPSKSEAFDEDLKKAIIQFQKQHFLKADGIIGKATCAALNMTIADRIRKIKLNLKRWEKLSPLLNGRYILVNIPTYHLEAMHGSKTELSQAVIVGMKSRPTPIFTTTMTAIILNPAWYVPNTILFNDKLQRIKADPDYLTRNQYLLSDSEGELIDPHDVDWSEISEGYLPYRIRQLPGKNNALGVIKFFLEGKNGIYMHDTPQPKLFLECPRAFSSGCVRLSSPFDLAIWALNKTDPESIEKLKQQIKAGQTKTLNIPNPIPVYFIYITVWIEDNDQALFSDDPYDRDKSDMKKEGIPSKNL
jgi:murein L,D-transpeptidase YcbB/YkuD